MTPTMRLVFVHGSGGTGLVWRYQLERFPDALAVTLPGHPDGEPCDGIEGAAAWLREELGRQGVGRPVIVGHSLGGAIALQYALDHPGEAAGLVLVGSGARLRVLPATLAALEQALDRPESFKGMVADSWKKAAPDMAAQLDAQAVALGPAPFLNDLRACDRFDVIERLGEIATPTLAITGTEDVMTPPKYAEFLVGRMPDATVELVEGGTHFVFVEQPGRVNDAIAGFLDRLA